MSSLSELIERVEKASGASREIDALIFCTMSGCYDWKYAVEHCDAYTASIDAALTLLPEGFAAAVGTMAFKNCDKKPWATYWTPQGVPHSVEAATPALAVVIAALKARLLDAASSETAHQ